ncbi:hypothetical protein PR202_ga13462 [Eleusine coracana subsp. coracana]|uniref:GDSL esterase/lipase n=1 Tax=Eleusine coracana subsp. coracana TaxID=191504 RepID=A0AAV5CES4_ELECO|nr:hypothetical protein PR202_ga13462 [Eleusine coracana subsp. coracana]
MLSLLILLLLNSHVVLCGCYKRIFSFGDSIIDTAQSLQLPLIPPNLPENTSGQFPHGANFAVLGVTAFPPSFYKGCSRTNVWRWGYSNRKVADLSSSSLVDSDSDDEAEIDYTEWRLPLAIVRAWRLPVVLHVQPRHHEDDASGLFGRGTALLLAAPMLDPTMLPEPVLLEHPSARISQGLLVFQTLCPALLVGLWMSPW